jgi:hypothetical protein
MVQRREFLRAGLAGLVAIAGCNKIKNPWEKTPPPPPFYAPTTIAGRAGVPSQYDLTFVNKEGEYVTFPLLNNAGTLQTGEPAGKLTSLEGNALLPGDYCVLNKPGSDRTRVVQFYDAVSMPPGAQLIFNDMNGIDQYLVTTDASGNGTLVAADAYALRYSNPALEVDMDGDGTIGTAESHLVNVYNGILRIANTPEPEPAVLHFFIPAVLFSGTLDELVDINIIKSGANVTLDVPDQPSFGTFTYDSARGLYVAKTLQYGVLLEWNKNIIPNELTIQTPQQASP